MTTRMDPGSSFTDLLGLREQCRWYYDGVRQHHGTA